MKVISPKRLMQSVFPTVRNGSIFNASSLDLQFARTKTLDPRITFSRTSSGTFVDSQGVLRMATTNLLVRSEEFDNASWAKTLSTVTANAAAGPNGLIAADKLTGNSTVDGHYVQQNVSGATSGISYTSSVYAKASEISRIEILHAVGSTLYVQGYDLSNGTLLTRVTPGTAAATGGFIQSVGDGWYRCGITQISDGTSGAMRITLRSANTVTFDATSVGVLLFGAQLEQSSTVGEYVPSNTTFTSRASNATFYNSGGIIETAGVNVARDRAFLPDENGVMRSAGRLLLEPAATNLLTYSEDFSNAAWSTSSTAVTTNTTTAPDGTTTADSLLETTAHLDHVLYATSPQTFTTATHSIYVKPNGRNNVLLRFYHAPNDWISSVFSLTGNGSVTQTSAGSSSAFTAVSRSIVNVGNGWYRVSMTATQSSRATFAAVVDLCTSSTPTLGAGNGSEAYTGDSTKGLYLWGAQFETGTVATSYIPTVASQVTRSADVSSSTANSTPRFNHDPTTGESLGLLVEEQRTNLLTYSEQFDNATWGPVRGTVTANAALSPSGTTTADKLIMANGGADGQYYQGVTITSGATVTGSIYVKESGADRFQIVLLSSGNTTPYGRATFNASTGAITSAAEALNGASGASASATAVGNGWYRCVVTVTYPAVTSAGMRLTVTMADGSNGDGVKGVFAWGAQLEAGAFATSYIPTTTAAATRSADVASITGSNFSSWYRQDEGSLFTDCSINYTVPGTSFPLVASLNDGTSNNRIENGFLTSTLAGFEVVTGGVGQVGAYPNAGSTLTRRLGTCYRANDCAVSVNGTSVNTDTSGSLPTVDRLRIGDRAGSPANALFGTIRRLTYWPSRLSNTTLQQITQ
jgi:hypothetical protein